MAIWHRLFCWFTKPSLSSTTAERFRFLTKCFDNVLGNPYKISACQILRLVFQNLSAVALLGPHVAGIRDGDNPIGGAQPKNWNLWLCHIKQRSGKKVDKVLCWWYRDWWQSIRGMTREVLKCLLLLYESKEWPKKKHPPTDENGKKHQNRHEMVIHGSKWDVDHTKMIRKTRSTKPRSSYCAKTLKMKV